MKFSVTGRDILLLLLMACAVPLTVGHLLSPAPPREEPQNASPVVLTLWHYYSGQTKAAVDELLAEFNAGPGAREGIKISAYSHGDVRELAEAVFDAANHTAGSPPMPDLFAAYPDNAYRIAQVTDLANLDDWFTPEEQAEYRQEFLNEGRFGPDNGLRVFPVAKSTENLFLNRTAWNAFAAATGAQLADLATWEGVTRTAERYHAWSNGRAFFELDSPSNFFMLAARQLNEPLYTRRDGTVRLHISRRLARAVWDAYHAPYLRGWYAKTGRFSTDDVRTGAVVAYVGSSAGAVYFPTEVTDRDGRPTSITCSVLPYPRFEAGEAWAVMQGAGLCVVKSDPAREQAASVFLKWFTHTTANVRFAAATGYLPVKNASLQAQLIQDAAPEEAVAASQPAVVCSLTTTLSMLGHTGLDSPSPFRGSYALRVLWDRFLQDEVRRDLEAVHQRMERGEERAKAVAAMLTNERFEQWYQRLVRESAAALNL